VSAGSVPSTWAVASTSEDDRVDALRRERSLLYVAASRARDELVVTWKGEPSRLAAVPPQGDEPASA
jgi:superfamily I DNA/RNA helicase